MVSNRIRRPADSGVATAVASIIQHQKFKKMLIFGLRSLADLCSPSLQLFVENSLDALDKNVVPGILTAVENFSDDEDITLCASQILSAMACGCVEEKDNPAIVKKLLNDGGLKAIEKILSTSPSDELTLDHCFTFIDKLSTLGSIPNGGLPIIPNICKALDNVSSADVAGKAMLCFCFFAKSGAGSVAIRDNGGIKGLLTVCVALSSDSQIIPIVENCFKALKSIADLKVLDDTYLEMIITLVEICKSSKLVMNRASDIIKAVVSTEKLQQSLTGLQKYEPGTQEHKVAVNTLKSLSYITTIADELAKANGIPLLIDLIQNTVPKLASHGADIADVICGASRMLAGISSNYGKEVIEHSGIKTLVAALAATIEYPSSVSAISDALASLLRCGCEPFLNHNAIGVALPILYQLSENATVASSLMNFVSAASQFPELHSEFVENKVIEILSTCCQYHVNNLAYHMNTIQVLNRFSSYVKDLSTVYEYGGLQGIAISLAFNYKDLKYCLETLDLLLTFAATPGAQQYMTSGDTLVTDSILELMIFHRDNALVIDRSVKVLEILVVDEDVKRYMSGLTIALPNAREDVEGTYRKLAAVTGLYRIARLRPSIAAHSVLPQIMKTVSSWVEGAQFEGRTMLTRAALQTTLLSSEDGNGCQAMITTVSDLACLSQVKRIIDLENVEDNFLLHCTFALKQLCSVERSYAPEQCVETVEAVSRVMRKYSDIRQAEMACIEAISNFIKVTGKIGLDALISTGALAGIVSYLTKVPMYLNCQILGISLLCTCAQMDPSAVECLKKCNCFQLLRIVNRTHTRNRRLKTMVGMLLSMLMPADALETELSQLFADLENYMSAKDFEGVHTTLVSINQLLVSKEAIRISARLNIGDHLTKASSWIIANVKLADKVAVHEEGDLTGKDLVDSVLYELAQVTLNMCQTRIGLVYCTKMKFPCIDLHVFSNLKGKISPYMEDAAVASLDALTLLFSHDKLNIDVALSEDIFSKICQSLSIFLDSPGVIRSICKCIASLCSTPGRIEKLVTDKDFVAFSNKLVSVLQEDSVPVKLNSLAALYELLKTKDDCLLDYFSSQTCIITSLIHVLEMNADNAELVKLASECLGYFGKKRLLSKIPELVLVLDHVSKAMNLHKCEESVVLPLLKFLVELICNENKDLFKQSGIVNVISSVMMIHVGNDEIAQLGGILFGYLGAECQIRALMRNVIEVVEKKEDTMPQEVDKLCTNLAIYLLSPLENREEALAETEKFLSSVNTCMAYAADNQNLMVSTTCVSRRLCDSAFDDYEDQFGAWAVGSSSNLSQIAAIVNTDFGACNMKFLCHAYRVFSACAVNIYTTDLMQTEATKLMARTFELLERYKANPDLTHAILDFLLYLSKSPLSSGNQENSGSGVILGQAKLLNVNVVTKLIDSMTNNKSLDSVVVPAMNLLSQLASCSSELPRDSVNDALDVCDRLCIGEVSEERKQAYIGLVISLLKNGYIKDSKHIDAICMMITSGGCEGITALQFIAAAAAGGFLKILEKLGVIKKLSDMLDSNSCQDKDFVLALLAALDKMVEADPENSAVVLKSALPQLLHPATILLKDAEAAHAFLDLLAKAAKTEGVGRILNSIKDLFTILGGIKEFAKSVSDSELEKKVIQVMEAIKSDLPKKKTCQTVYISLEAKKQDGASINAAETPLLVEDIRFLVTTMEGYVSKTLSYDDEDGLDHTFGSMSIELLSKVSDNGKILVDIGAPAVMLKALSTQRDLKILNATTSALCSACLNATFVVSLVSNKASLSEISKYLAKLHAKDGIIVPPPTQDSTTNVLELALINALMLVENSAVNRRIYLNSDVINVVVKIWDAYDAKEYTALRLLRQIFRTLRKIVAEEHLDIMLRCRMVSRIKTIFSESKDHSVIPDALFLVGSLAVVPTMKNQIYEEKLLDSIIELVQRHLAETNDSTHAIVTNACLALANICVETKVTSERFIQLNGPKYNVDVLTKFKDVHEVVNGGSILLCNLLYKNDTLKELYGKNGAPAALVNCLTTFASSSDELSMRCIETLFKAISNLGLYAKNVSFFLDAGVHNSFQVWLSHLDAGYPDAKLKIGLQTLSNLVMENKVENMTAFGIVQTPILGILTQERVDGKVMFLLLDILSSLCRFEANCKAFLEQDGLYLTMRTMRRMNYDIEILIAGLHLLGVQTQVEGGVVKLLEMNAYSLLLDILTFEGQGSELNEVLVASLRCMRRLITSAEMVYLLCSQDGLKTIINLAVKAESQSSVIIECCRLLLGMLALTGGTAETDAPAWENIGLERDNIDAIIRVICFTSGMENAKKMARLQRILMSVVCYFLSCGIGGEALAVNGFSGILESYLANFGTSYRNFIVSTVTLENVFLLSTDLRNNIVTRDVIKKYKDAVGYLPVKKPEEKAFKERCQKLLDALSSSSEDVKLESTGKFDFGLSGWSVDPYPNGTQDLPEASKDALRTGGRFKAFLDENGPRVGVRWRSTQDLNFLEWGRETEEFPHRFPILRIRNIARGLKHPLLEKANAKQPRKVNAQNCFCIIASATEEFPDGCTIPVKCKTLKEREALVELLIQWRDAASYN
ncbi:hypothetical protein BEWA_033840 [Theileria equi strain WA]|uniref:Anonymous antigen-1 n=1 Tax=Theileria equi strain WA TaxID=1537102 RepID=L0B070_THEEQ|nr:hypothetical protein BEWA_033840 [Theileria equi strain WA]AFZ80529.1 hypothetical protein BEWA_033840 [Theileria equi strain WA]|eukprot:XP_004830195.1 hypothetical protein BEWA_033840 [Theileria equi strain WA]